MMLQYLCIFSVSVFPGEGNLLAILKQRWWKYMILGLIDIEANYLVLKAYQYTTLSSVQVGVCVCENLIYPNGVFTQIEKRKAKLCLSSPTQVWPWDHLCFYLRYYLFPPNCHNALLYISHKLDSNSTHFSLFFCPFFLSVTLCSWSKVHFNSCIFENDQRKNKPRSSETQLCFIISRTNLANQKRYAWFSDN